MRLNKTALRVLFNPFTMTWASLEGPLSGAMFITHQGKRLWVSREAHSSSTWKSSLLLRVCTFAYSWVDVVALWRCVCLAWASNPNQQLLITDILSACFFPGDIFSNSTEILRRFQKMTTKFKRKVAATVSAGGGRGSSLHLSKRPSQWQPPQSYQCESRR